MTEENKEEKKVKTTIREGALAHEQKKTKVISELKKFNANLDLEEFEGTTGEGKDFTYMFTTIDGERYRVPDSVLSQMKIILEDNPDIMEFKVKKTGEGKEHTKYTVIPV